MSFGVYSEVGELNAVLLHRPGDELKRLTINNYQTFLFDSIPHLPETQQSHDLFSKYLCENHVQVFYVKDLLYETLEQSNEARHTLIKDLIHNCSHINNKTALKSWLSNRTNKQLVDDIIVGVSYTKDELGDTHSGEILCNENEDNNEFLILPLPNLLYIRDSFSIINTNIFIWSMFYDVRKNETLLVRIIFQYNKRFEFLSIYNWKHFNKNNHLTIEGGDIAYLGSNILLVGLSERTNKYSIETLLQTNLFDKIFVVKIPAQRIYMHLDMILSQVSRNIFTFHQPLQQKIEIFHLQQKCQWISYGQDLPKALTLLLDRSLFFYDSIDEITSTDEQSLCRHNVFALREHHVITYDGDIDPIKSIYTQMIEHKQHRCRVGLIKAKGLVEGGGGAHCITNAIARQAID